MIICDKRRISVLDRRRHSFAVPPCVRIVVVGRKNNYPCKVDMVVVNIRPGYKTTVFLCPLHAEYRRLLPTLTPLPTGFSPALKQLFFRFWRHRNEKCPASCQYPAVSCDCRQAYQIAFPTPISPDCLNG